MTEPDLMWYEIYVSILMDIGLQLNYYYMCVANKYISGKHCTIA